MNYLAIKIYHFVQNYLSLGSKKMNLKNQF